MQCVYIFCFNDPAATGIYTLSLHAALPISRRAARQKRSPSDEYFRTQPSKVHFKPPKLTLSEFELRLQEFQAVDPDAAEVVRLLFLSGRSMRQTASDLGITLGSVRAHWAYARAWLSQRAKQDQE